MMSEQDLLEQAMGLISNSSDWKLANDYDGFSLGGEQILPPRTANQDSMRWTSAARKWLDNYYLLLQQEQVDGT